MLLHCRNCLRANTGTALQKISRSPNLVLWNGIGNAGINHCGAALGAGCGPERSFGQLPAWRQLRACLLPRNLMGVARRAAGRNCKPGMLLARLTSPYIRRYTAVRRLEFGAIFIVHGFHADVAQLAEQAPCKR